MTEAPAEDAAAAEPEVEVFYTFTWGGNRPNREGGGRREGGGGGGKPKGKPRGKGGPKGGGKPQNFSARPAKKEKAIDPDNPFAAALGGLKKD